MITLHNPTSLPSMPRCGAVGAEACVYFDRTADECSTCRPSPVVPAPSVPPDIASALRLDRGKGLTPIGYWRSAPDGGGSEHHEAAARARLDLTGPERPGTINGMSHRAMAAVELPLLEQRAAAWDSLPWPGDHVDPTMEQHEREHVASMLDSAPIFMGFCGVSWDRLAPLVGPRGRRTSNGSSERSLAGYVWPEGLAHYVRTYGLRLDPVFLDAVAKALNRGEVTP